MGISLGSLIKVNQRSNINRNVFLAISIAFSVSILIIVTYFPNVFPPMYVEGIGITPTKVALEYVVIGFLALGGIMYFQQYVRGKDYSNFLFTVALTISIFSELAFVQYDSVYDIYNYVGHAYKIIAYFIIFRIAFINNIERPYRALYDARDKLREYSGDLNRRVFERTKELNLLNKKLLDDLEYAREVQNAILPEEPAQQRAGNI